MPGTFERIEGFLVRMGPGHRVWGDPYEATCVFRPVGGCNYEAVGLSGNVGMRGLLDVMVQFETELGGHVSEWQRSKGGVLKRIKRPPR